VPLTEGSAIAAVNKLIEVLEDHDDVKAVYSNAEIQEQAAAR
jgi:transcriptional/translational regulatory protein YebC/TACO1